jgi:hypothetical protein
MKQNEKVTVKLTLEMDVESALTNFDDCKTAEDIVDCMVLELNDQFACTGSGITITDTEVIKKPEHPHDKMSNEEAINQLNFMMEIMPKEPPEECDDIDEWLDTDKDIRTTFDMAIKALKQNSCNDAISRQAAVEFLENSVKNFKDPGSRIVFQEAALLFASLLKNANLPSVTQAQKWIPFSEEQPKDRDWYLGIFKESDTGWINPIPYICDYVGHETKATTKDYWILKDCTDRDEHIDYYFNLECVAWQPLPNPYQEEIEGETEND